MKQIKITGENKKTKPKELLSHFYTEDLDKYDEMKLIEMYDALGYYKISKNNFDIICVRKDGVKENDMWTKDQQKYLDNIENNLHKKIDGVKSELNQKIDDVKIELNQKIDDVKIEMNQNFNKIFKHLGIE